MTRHRLGPATGDEPVSTHSERVSIYAQRVGICTQQVGVYTQRDAIYTRRDAIYTRRTATYTSRFAWRAVKGARRTDIVARHIQGLAAPVDTMPLALNLPTSPDSRVSIPSDPFPTAFHADELHGDSRGSAR